MNEETTLPFSKTAAAVPSCPSSTASSACSYESFEFSPWHQAAAAGVEAMAVESDWIWHPPSASSSSFQQKFDVKDEDEDEVCSFKNLVQEQHRQQSESGSDGELKSKKRLKSRQPLSKLLREDEELRFELLVGGNGDEGWDRSKKQRSRFFAWLFSLGRKSTNKKPAVPESPGPTPSSVWWSPIQKDVRNQQAAHEVIRGKQRSPLKSTPKNYQQHQQRQKTPAPLMKLERSQSRQNDVWKQRQQPPESLMKLERSKSRRNDAWQQEQRQKYAIAHVPRSKSSGSTFSAAGGSDKLTKSSSTGGHHKYYYARSNSVTTSSSSRNKSTSRSRSTNSSTSSRRSWSSSSSSSSLDAAHNEELRRRSYLPHHSALISLFPAGGVYASAWHRH